MSNLSVRVFNPRLPPVRPGVFYCLLRVEKMENFVKEQIGTIDRASGDTMPKTGLKGDMGLAVSYMKSQCKPSIATSGMKMGKMMDKGGY